MPSASAAPRALLALALLARAAAAAVALDLAVDCTTSSPLAPFWQSVGMTPATYMLRADELENVLLIGAVPNRGVRQVRIHYLLDLVTVLGFAPSAATPSGWSLDYDFGQLDFALDFLFDNGLAPGFEVMGSPRGFPSLPDSFYTTFNGNGHILPAQTLAMFRQLVADVLARCVRRYGKDWVSAWHIESWNEPDQGWGELPAWTPIAGQPKPPCASADSSFSPHAQPTHPTPPHPTPPHPTPPHPTPPHLPLTLSLYIYMSRARATQAGPRCRTPPTRRCSPTSPTGTR